MCPWQQARAAPGMSGASLHLFQTCPKWRRATAPATARGCGGHGKCCPAVPPATPRPPSSAAGTASPSAPGSWSWSPVREPAPTSATPPTAWGHGAGWSPSAWSVSRAGISRRSRAGSDRANQDPSFLPQDEPTLTERGCPAHRTWVEGERRELACRADGDPPPSTRCARDGGATRARGSRAVSRADAGRYVCRATNKHGSAVRSVVVTVECECRGEDEDLVVPGMPWLCWGCRVRAGDSIAVPGIP